MKKLFLLVLPVTILCSGASVGATATKVNVQKELYKAEDNPVMHDFYRLIRKFSSGVTIKGSVVQTRSEGRLITPTDIRYDQNVQDQAYGVTATFQNGDITGTSLIHTGHFQGMETVIDSLVVFEDEDGYSYGEYLDYSNSIQREYKIESGNKLSFSSAGLTNPFHILKEDDFMFDKVNQNIHVSKAKTSIIIKNILGHVNVGFNGIITNSYMVYANDQITRFVVDMDPIYRFEEVPVKYANKVSFTFTDIGTAKLPEVKKYEAKPENQRLNTALKSVQDDFVLTMETDVKRNDAESVKSYKRFEFDADSQKVLVHYYDNPAEATIRSAKDFLLAPDDSDKLYASVYDPSTEAFIPSQDKNIEGFAGSYQGAYYYEDLLPRIKEVSTDFFTYDKKSNEYVCDDFAVLNQINRFFAIGKDPFNSSDIDYATKVGIRLKGNGDLDSIKYYINYIDPFTGVKSNGTVTLKYTSIGEVEL